MDGNAPIGAIDLSIIAGYFLIVFGIGYIIAKRTESGDDLFLAGRSLAWGAIGFSLFASNISSTTLIGLAGDAYRTGIAVSNYEWMAGVVLVFISIFFIPFFIRSGLTTIPEYLEKRFDVRSRKYFSGLSIFTSIMIDTAGGIYAGALVLKVFFPELLPGLEGTTDFIATCFLLALVAGLYTAAGGLAAVVYTDVLQAVILIIGSTFVAYETFAQFNFSWEAATAQLPEGHLSLIRPMDAEGVPWLGTLIGVPVLGFYYWGLNQYIIQRVLGAKDLDNARWGAMLGGALKILPLFIMVLPGAFALELYPNLSQPDQVFPTLVTDLLPVGVLGLVMAGLVAAIMSSIDSTLNSASTLITIDFIKPNRPELTPKQVGRIGRITTLVLMLVAAAWAPAILEFQGLWSYIQQMLSYLVPPVVAVFLFGVFDPRANGNGAFATLLGGHALSFVTFLLVLNGFITIHFTIIAGILTALCCVLMYVASRALGDAPAEENVDDLTWAGRALETPDALPWYKDWRVHGGAVLTLTAIMLVIFW
ncbi:sodium:solute symporter [Salisaeta longa]|uniref:sodium:solute symporter n=1 Tax=Salisaeta longa TaxID=503170 RepID=UPI0003B56F19|nr:sodium:solute symporter [Salisaeta longa]